MTEGNKGGFTLTLPSDREISFTRLFAVPRQLVFDAWTKPEHLPHWMLGPPGWTMPVCEVDLRPGGAWHFVWRREGAPDLDMHGTYQEVQAPERLVHTESWGGDWPETLNTMVLTEEGLRTRVVSTVLYPTKEARDAALKTGMKEGMIQSFDRLDDYALKVSCTPAPGKEHHWLQKLIGDWQSEMECNMGPETPPMKVTGKESVRSLGGLWVLCEGQSEMPGGGTGTTLMTLGYDPLKQRHIGTFVGSMMTHMWVYDGTLDPSARVLTLDTEGPSFTDPKKLVRYQDVIEFKSDDHRVLTSQTRGDDGNWIGFMTANYYRTK